MYSIKIHKVTKTAVTDVILERRKEDQESIPKVKWDGEETRNVWGTKYLDSMFEVVRGYSCRGCMTDVRTRIVTASQLFNRM